jgi:hypothetical protein
MRTPINLPMRHAQRASLAILLAMLCSAPVAGAVSPALTTQAKAADAVFLDYAPPPPGGADALCLVDTGVNPIADIAPGLVSATALDGGTGNDVDPLVHGTVDAAVAGGRGHGVLGAWPQLKIVSVRSTDVPNPGQEPTFAFNDYVHGIQRCTQPMAGVQVVAIDLPLASVISPTPDQSDAFAAAVNQAKAKGISILAAAGNDTPTIQLPASQPGIFAVGAGDGVNAICSFSATTGLTFFAPGCDIDQIDTHGETLCCGNGTSQASAYAAGVLVALRSYDPALSADKAVGLLLSTTVNGHLNATAAFRAAGLGAIVDAGNAAIPQPAPAPPAAGPAAGRVPRPSVRRATWRHGILQITLRRLPKGTRLHVKIMFAHRSASFLASSHRRLRVRTPSPRRVVAYLSRGAGHSDSVPVTVTRPRR